MTDIIYVPKLRSNLLSVGRMTNSNVNVQFGKHMSWPIFKGKIIAYGLKENNLYTYCCDKNNKLSLIKKKT